jgi:hypothetical protein
MRSFLASSIGVACTAVLAAPLAPLSEATPAHVARHPAAGARLAGSTRSLPLGPLAGGTGRAARPAAGAQGVRAGNVEPFSLVGVVWDDPAADLHGTVQVRTRADGTRRWSPWQDVGGHHDDAPDPGRREGVPPGHVRGGTAPLWVGASNAVDVRVLPRPSAPALPAGLRAELVDPGEGPGPEEFEEDRPGEADYDNGRPPRESAALANLDLAPPGAPQIEAEDTVRAGVHPATGPDAAPRRPFIGPRPRIVTRAGWGADERLRERTLLYTRAVKAAFLHHSATGNHYACRDAPAVLRALYRYHVRSAGWRDIGYNFVVDKCGTVYEGRAGGVTRPVQGAHTRGFNRETTGIAVLGTYDTARPPARALRAVARLTAWKLGLSGADPRGSTYLVSRGGNKFKKGTRVRLNVIAGHRDGFVTDCPGRRLYGRLRTARHTSAELQGR